MKIREKQVMVYDGQGTFDNIPQYRAYTKRTNEDGKEILGWMRKMAKIDAFGLREIPIHRGNALGRFMQIDAIANGGYVVMYVVRETGLYRVFIDVNSLYFTNNGSASMMSALSEVSLIKNILKYKDGKRVDAEGLKGLKSFRKRMIKMVENGGVKPPLTPIQKVFKDMDLDLPSDIQTMDKLNAFIEKNMDVSAIPSYTNNGDPYWNHHQLIDDTIEFNKTF